jgi:hypothetical protein
MNVKEYRHSTMLLRWKFRIPWRSMEESRITISSFRKTYIQNIIPKFEGIFGREFQPIKTPMSKG